MAYLSYTAALPTENCNNRQSLRLTYGSGRAGYNLPVHTVNVWYKRHQRKRLFALSMGSYCEAAYLLYNSYIGLSAARYARMHSLAPNQFPP